MKDKLKSHSSFEKKNKTTEKNDWNLKIEKRW